MIPNAMRREAEAAGEQAMAELEALMCSIAAGALPLRADATAYSRCRSDLLASPDMVLPGFLHQCMTVFKFRDFISLYDPDAEARESFVRRAFDRCREVLAGDATAAGATSPAGSSRRWRF